MSLAAFDHPILSALLGDDEVARHLSAAEEIAGYDRFEIALAEAEAAEGIIPAEAARAIAGLSGQSDLAALREGAARDGVGTVAYVRDFRARLGAEYGAHLHIGATSQDLVDTALVLRLRAVLAIFDRRLGDILSALEHLSAHHGNISVMGRTRMQDALPITAGARIEAWSLPLARHRTRLAELRPRLLVLQFGGAVGTLDALGAKGHAVAERIATALDLGLPTRSWHSQRDSLAEFASCCALIAGSLGKMGEDVALMALAGEIALDGAGGSSAMPHKQNPVKAEVLVALARYAATLVGGMNHAQIHEYERSGAAWTLEWLILPQLVMTTGTALRVALELSGTIRSIGDGGSDNG